MITRPSSYAVIFKSYMWDDFVSRQAHRCAAAAAHGDFFISLDETNKPLGPVPFETVLRTNCNEMIELGLQDRFEHGSLLWWNADYAHYHFYANYPTYDYYVFVEYDAAVCGQLDSMVERMATDGIDFTCLPIQEKTGDWCWTVPHQAIYAKEELRGALISVSITSRAALEHLFRRRLDMAKEPVPYWPSAEVFMLTELIAATFRTMSLSELGDVSRLDWYPPMLEKELSTVCVPGFVHPVYDAKRFLSRVRSKKPDVWSLLRLHDVTVRSLVRHHPTSYAGLLLKAIALGGVRSGRRGLRQLRSSESSSK